MALFSNQSQRIVFFFVCLFTFFALYNHLFLSYDQRQTVDHEFFYTNNAISAHYAANYQGEHDISQVIFGRSHRPNLISGYLYAILQLFPHNFYQFRAWNLPFFFLIILAAFLLGRELNGNEVGVASAAICATIPVFINYLHRWHYHYQTFGLCMIGIYLALHIAHRPKASRPIWWIGLGATFGIASLIHPIAILYYPIALLLIVIHLPFAAGKDRKKSFAFLGLSIVALLAITIPFYFSHLDAYIDNLLYRYHEYNHWYFKIFGSLEVENLVVAETGSSTSVPFNEILNGFKSIFRANNSYILELPYFQIFFLFVVPLLSLPFVLMRRRLTKKTIKHLECLIIVIIILFMRSYFINLGTQFFDWSAFFILLAPLSISLLYEWLTPQETEDAKPPAWRQNVFRLLVGFWAVAGFGMVLYSYFGSFYYDNPDGLSSLNRFYFRGEESFVRREQKLMFHVHFEPNNSGKIERAISSRYPPNSHVRIVYRKMMELNDGNWQVEPMDLEEVGINYGFQEIYHGLYFDKIFMPQHQPFIEEDLDAEAFDSYDQIIYLFVRHLNYANREIPLHEAISGPYQTVRDNFPGHQIIKFVHSIDTLSTDADIWNNPLFVLAPKKNAE